MKLNLYDFPIQMTDIASMIGLPFIHCTEENVSVIYWIEYFMSSIDLHIDGLVLKIL